MPVTQDLHLHMARAAHQLFQINLVVTESGQRLALGQFHHRRQVGFGLDHAHAATTATPTGFEHQRVADGQRHDFGAFNVVRQGTGCRHYRYTGFDRHGARRDFVAQRAHHIAVGADEGNPCGRTSIGKVRVLGQKSVAGVNRIHIGLQRDADDVANIQIGLDRLLARTDQVRLVRLESV